MERRLVAYSAVDVDNGQSDNRLVNVFGLLSPGQIGRGIWRRGSIRKKRLLIQELAMAPAIYEAESEGPLKSHSIYLSEI